MKKLLLVLLVGFLCNTVVAQTTTEKTENVKVEQTVKKCSDDKAKNVAVKTLKLTIKQKQSLVQEKNQVALKIK